MRSETDSHPPEFDLLRRCLQGEDHEAWEMFVKQYSKPIWAAIQRTFCSYRFHYQQDDSEDVFSAVFMALVEDDFRRLRQYRAENSCTLSTWLTVVATRMAIDYMRSDKRHITFSSVSGNDDLLSLLPDSAPSALLQLERKQLAELLRQALEQLPDQDRLLILLLVSEGLAPPQVSDLLGIAVDALYTRKHRIIERLKKNIHKLQENRVSNV